jgi:hypothetical protein
MTDPAKTSVYIPASGTARIEIPKKIPLCVRRSSEYFLQSLIESKMKKIPKITRTLDEPKKDPVVNPD